jgi:hypothetical protein
VSTIPLIWEGHRFLLEIVGDYMYYAAKADVKFITYIEQVDAVSWNTYVTFEFIAYCAGVVM